MRNYPIWHQECALVLLTLSSISLAAQTQWSSALDLDIPGLQAGNVRSITAADIDGNGTPDLALAVESLAAPVLYLQQSGDQPAFISVQAPELPTGSIGTLVIQDVSGDHRPDLVVTSADGSQIGIALNSAQQTGARFEPFHLINTLAPAEHLLVVDMNMDGRKDIITAGNDRVLCYRNAGFGGEGESMFPAAELMAGMIINDIKAGDLQGDGNPDLVCATADGMIVWPNLTDFKADQFRFTTPVEISAGFAVHALDMGDLNGDFLPDLISANYPSDAIAVWENASSGNSIAYRAPVVITTMASGHVALGDVNGDGNFDIIAASADYGISLTESFANTSANGKLTFNDPVAHAATHGIVYTRNMFGDAADEVIAFNATTRQLSVIAPAAETTITACNDLMVYCNEEGSAALEWTAGNVAAGAQFIVERTLDGKTFEQLETLEAIATKTYSVSYNQSASVTAFYRIVIRTSGEKNNASSLQRLTPCMSIVSDFVCVFPNPVDKVMQFSFAVTESVNMQYAIVDLNMRTHLEFTNTVNAGNNTQTVTVDQLPKGSYLFVVSFGNQPPYVCRFEKR